MTEDTPRTDESGVADPGGPLAGKRFVLSGVSRLSLRVAQDLAERGGQVVMVGEDPDGLLAGVRSNVDVVPPGEDHEGALVRAGLAEAECLLLLADNDLENLRAAVACRAVAPSVPVVLRAFDATLADQLERGLNVRRAHSVSSLAAASFVAAVLGAEVLETLRLGDLEVPIVRLHLEAGSPLAGLTASALKRRSGCALLGRAGPDGAWRPAAGDSLRLAGGDRVAVGGRLTDALSLARDTSALPQTTRPGELIARLRDDVARWRRARSRPSRARSQPTLLPFAVAAFFALVLATMIVFAVTLHLDPIEALYEAVLTAFGSPSVSESASWLKVFALAAVIAGGALVGILFGYVAAYATTERLERRMGRRARQLRHHVVIAGLGKIGYRVERLLFELGIPSVVVERSPDPRYVSAVGERTPILSGDVRLPENLEHAGIGAAFAFVACTDDDLANIEACIQARKLRPGIRTVARIFDATLAERMTEPFGVDAAISTTRVAAQAFVGAAVDERSMRRFAIDGTDYLAMRIGPGRVVPPAILDRWREAGIRILAVRLGEGPTLSPAGRDRGIDAGESAILAGPEEAVTDLVL